MDKEEIKKLLLVDLNNYTDREKMDMLLEIGDNGFIIAYLEKNVLGQSRVIELLKKKSDFELIKKCIRSERIRLSRDDRLLLALKINDKDFILGDKKIKSINLPEEVKVGIEIETEGGNSFFLLQEFDYDGWEVKRDNSLENGVEVASPVLDSSIKSVDSIYMVNEVLRKMGQDVSENCAAHIHIGAEYLKSKQAYINLMEIWHNCDKVIYAITNKKGEAPRPKVVEYAAPISNEIMKILEDGVMNLEDEEDLDEFIYDIKVLQTMAVREKTGNKGRHSGLNVLNVSTNKNTVEYRVPNGTMDADLWIDNINLFGGIIVASQKLAELQEKLEVTKEEYHQLELFDELKSDIDEEERAKILFELIDDDSQIYIDRYHENIKLFDKCPWLKAAFGKSKIVKLTSSKDKVEIQAIEDVSAVASARKQQEAEKRIIKDFGKNKENDKCVSK